jgi:hypothetical protein
MQSPPLSLVVEAPIVAPRLMPETLNGYWRPWKIRSPRPPPAPKINPPLVNTRLIVPVSACDAVERLAIATRPSTAPHISVRTVRAGFFIMVDLLLAFPSLYGYSTLSRTKCRNGESTGGAGCLDRPIETVAMRNPVEIIECAVERQISTVPAVPKVSPRSRSA